MSERFLTSDEIVRKHTAFDSLEELLERQVADGYRPTLSGKGVQASCRREISRLADSYDFLAAARCLLPCWRGASVRKDVCPGCGGAGCADCADCPGGAA